MRGSLRSLTIRGTPPRGPPTRRTRGAANRNAGTLAERVVGGVRAKATENHEEGKEALGAADRGRAEGKEDGRVASRVRVDSAERYHRARKETTGDSGRMAEAATLGRRRAACGL